MPPPPPSPARRLLGQGVPRDLEGAFHDFNAAAQQGDVYAIFNVGYMYMRGMHVAANLTAASDHFQRAAAKNFSAGYNGLGVLYWLGGPGIERNLSRAFQLFELGAAGGNADCLYNLATM